MRKVNFIIIFAALFASVIFVQCKHKDDTTPSSNSAITDDALFAEVNKTTGYTYYMGDAKLLAKTSPSAHSAFFRVRFNAIALAALTDNGKLPSGSTFPEGSIIIKELHNTSNSSAPSGHAIMQKATGDPNAADGGWVWAEYFGSVNSGFSVSTKGSACNGCHSDAGNRDKVRLFELFP